MEDIPDDAPDGMVVRIRRTTFSGVDDLNEETLEVREWGDARSFTPTGDATIQLQLSGPVRLDHALVDALADRDPQDGPPHADPAFMQWSTPLSGGGLLRDNHVYAVEGLLEWADGVPRLLIRAEADAGMDRIVLVERWLAADAWRELVVAWSYSYNPALVRAEGFSVGLPYRLVTAHPLVAWWQARTGSPPAAPRRRDANHHVDYRPYNQALTAWLGRACDVVFADRADQNAADLNQLLDIATTVDNPWAEVYGLRLSECGDFLDSEAGREAMAVALWRRAFPYGPDVLEDVEQDVGPFEAGSDATNEMLLLIQRVIDDGDWDPEEAGQPGLGLYENMEDTFEALLAPARANPESFVETTLHLEASECSEDAVVLIDLRDGTMLIIRTLPNC